LWTICKLIYKSASCRLFYIARIFRDFAHCQLCQPTFNGNDLTELILYFRPWLGSRFTIYSRRLGPRISK
jgi:hypothetical protein